MQTIIRDTFTIDNQKVYFETTGQGAALLFAHAGIVDSRMWDEQFAYFANYYQVIRYDMRGFGKSEPVKGPIARRRDIYHLMKHLGIENAALVGCSLGGENIIDFALEQPNMVTALVPVSTAPSGFQLQGEPPPALLKMLDAYKHNDLGGVTEWQMRLSVDGPVRQPEQVNPDVRRRAAEMNRIAVERGTYMIADAQPFEPLDPPAAARLKEIRVPTLVIAGALDEPEILRAADFIANEIPAARKVILPDSAHLPNMEQPAAFNQAVLEFLRAAAIAKPPQAG